MKTLMRLAVLVAALVMSAMGSNLRADYDVYSDFNDPHTVKSTYVVTPSLGGDANLWLPSRFKVCVELIDYANILNDRSLRVNVGGIGSVLVNRNYPVFMTYESAFGEDWYHLSLDVEWGDRYMTEWLQHENVEVRVTFFYQRWW